MLEQHQTGHILLLLVYARLQTLCLDIAAEHVLKV